MRHLNCSFTVDEFETQIEKVDTIDRDESLEVKNLSQNLRTN